MPRNAHGRRLIFGRLLARTAGHEIRLARDAAGTAFAAKSVRAGAGRTRVEALQREHAALARLCSPHVVASADLVHTAAGPCLLLEYLGGGDLLSLRGFEARHWLGAARDVAAGLGHMHACGLVHRDVKARNVRFAADGRACLIDLGSVAEIGTPAALGGTTAAHRRPGTAGRCVTPADDGHAFAVLLYELMTGRLPLGSEPGPDPARPAPIRAEPGLERLAGAVERALDPERRDVPEDIGIFRRMIESVMRRQGAAS